MHSCPMSNSTAIEEIDHELSLVDEASARVSYDAKRFQAGGGAEHQRRAVRYADEAVIRLTKVRDLLHTANTPLK